MAVESDADRAAFFELDEFAVPAVYTPNSGPAVNLKGLFDNGFVEVAETDHPGLASAVARFQCRSIDLPGTAASDNGDTLLVKGVIYRVRVIMADGEGVSDLALEDAS